MTLKSKKFDEVKRFIVEKNFASASEQLQNIRKQSLTKLDIDLINSLELKINYLSGGVNESNNFSDVLSPLFVIITPAFNSENYIDETIESVFSQRGNFRIRYHVQDGGSTDQTINKLKIWESKIRNSSVSGKYFSFTWSSGKDGGMYDAINKGFHTTCAEIPPQFWSSTYLSWINSDDILATNSLITVSTFFSSHAEVAWITGLSALMTEDGALTTTYEEPQSFNQSNIKLGFHDGRSLPFVQQEGTFWRYKLWDMSGGLQSKYKLAGDYFLWKKFSQYEKLVKLSSALAYHRRRQGQLSSDMGSYYKEIDDDVSVNIGDNAIQFTGPRCFHDPHTNLWNIWDVDINKNKLNSVDSDVVVVNDEVAKLSIPMKMPSGKPWPKISVITPSYNQGKYIHETIESVLSQNYPNVEHIIIDGGSTDETIAVVNKYINSIAYFVSEKDRGQSHALNKGFSVATGEIYTWLNSDDQFAEDALFSIALAFDTHNSDVVSGICEVYEDNILINKHMSSCQDGLIPLANLLDLDKGWNSGQFFYQPEVFFTKSLWERAGAHVREDCYYSMDYELWCRFAFAGAKIHVISASIAKFRMHPDQKTAAPEKFKKELISVRDKFCLDRGIDLKASLRADFIWDNSLNIAFVNDIGLNYGAGIAHGRLAASCEMAGQNVELFIINDYKFNNEVNHQSLMHDLNKFNPDVVVFGNTHSSNPSSTEVVDKVSKKYKVYWVTHDFWLLTGRCAYVGSCENYKYGCNDSCPTYDEYPVVKPELIYDAWKGKRDLLLNNDINILANSLWARNFYKDAIKNIPNNNVTINSFKLGVPSKLFSKIDKIDARTKLGISSDGFIIAFSVSSLKDQRKGGDYLTQALKNLNLPNIKVLLLGHVDVEINFDNVEVIQLGYVNDASTLVNALSAADVYVGPSLEETFGQVFIEAAHVGTPSIGFNQTGVVDAIIHGVTGVRVSNTSKDLTIAIVDLYNNKEKLNCLSFWSRIYAKNEFTLESCYRSFFHVLESQGVIDSNKMPHKIGFSKPITIIQESLGDISKWLPVKNISAQEGPYAPDFDFKFKWCLGPISSFRVYSDTAKSCGLKLIYRSPIFDKISAILNDQISGQTIKLVLQNTGSIDFVEFRMNLISGWNHVEMHLDNYLEPNDSEPRALSFMLIDFEIEVD